MSTAAQASKHIVRLNAKHGVDPFDIVGLLAIHALVEVDFPKLRLWKDVSGAMLQSGAVPA